MGKGMKTRWSDTQEKIIETKNKNMLVSAGAGAGKTAVLVEKIIRRVMDESDPVNIDQIMVVTFTEKAALEMKERISKGLMEALVKDPNNSRLKSQLQLLNKANISTLHSFCNELLRKYFYWLDLDPDFRIGNDHEVELIKDEVLENYLELLYSQEEKDFYDLVDLYGGSIDDSGLKQLILSLREFSRSHQAPLNWLNSLKEHFRLESAGKLSDTMYYHEVLEMLKYRIAKCKKMLKRAEERSLEAQGPYKYYETLKEEYEQLELLEEVLNSTMDLEEIRQYWTGFNFKKLPPIKKDDLVSEEYKEQVKELRDKVKEEIKSCSQKVLSRAEGELLQELKDTAPYMEKLVEIVIEFEHRFSRVKKQKKILDYSDLEHKVLELLEEEELIVELKDQYKEIMIDEYQDINGVQNQILETISDSYKDDYPYMFMVGDVKQSIYRFRLAEPGLFIAKYNNYINVTDDAIEANSKESTEGTDNRQGNNMADDTGSKDKVSPRLIELQENFRSSPVVIDGVNKIFRNIMSSRLGGIDYNESSELIDKKEFPSCGDIPGEKILVNKPLEVFYLSEEVMDKSLTGEENEASFIAKKVKELVDNRHFVYDDEVKEYRPVQYSDIVILNRQLQTHGERIAEIFAEEGIPFYVELNKGYFKAPEVQVMLSLLKVIDNPRQDIHLAAVFRSPVVNISEKDLFELRQTDLNKWGDKDRDLYDTITSAIAANKTESDDKEYGKIREKEETVKKIEDFLDKLGRWRAFSRKNSLSDLIWDIYEITGYIEFVRGLNEGDERKANLYALYDRALQFDTFSQSGLFRFLRFIEKLEERGEDLARAGVLSEKDNVVRLMSIHKSKGLEFPVVILMGMGKSFNTREMEKDLLIHKELGLGPKKVDTDKKIKYPTIAYEVIREKIKKELLSEELRILYVALTRAEEHIILVGSGKDPMAHFEENSSCFFDWVLPSISDDGDENFKLYCPGENELVKYSEEKNVQETISGEQTIGENNQMVEGYQGLDRVSWLEISPEIEENSHIEKIRGYLNWQYPYIDVVKSPAKLTVTQLQQQQELQDVGKKHPAQGPAKEFYNLRKPAFLTVKKGLTGAEIGTAYHLVFQHLPLKYLLEHKSYSNKLEITKRHLIELEKKEILTEAERTIIKVEDIVDFFETQLGNRIINKLSGLERELNFTLGVYPGEIEMTEKCSIDGSKPEPCEELGDKVVLQGAIDYLLTEADGAVIVDLKTDNVEKDNLPRLKEKYLTQMYYYKEAVERIQKQTVKEIYLYHIFHKSFVEVNF